MQHAHQTARAVSGDAKIPITAVALEVELHNLTVQLLKDPLMCRDEAAQDALDFLLRRYVVCEAGAESR